MPTPARIHESIVMVMRDIDAIGKEQRNASQGYSFRGIDDVYNELHSTLAKHGVFTVPKVLSERSEERTTNKGTNMIYRIMHIRFRFYATDGSFVDAVVVGEGMDSGDKACNKAMSVAHKYAFIQVFAIPTREDKDPEVDSHQTAPRSNSNTQQRQQVKAAPAPQPARSTAPAATTPTADPLYDGSGRQFDFVGAHAKTYGIEKHDNHVAISKFLIENGARSSSSRALIRDWVVSSFAYDLGVRGENAGSVIDKMIADVAEIPNKDVNQAITDWLSEYGNGKTSA